MLNKKEAMELFAIAEEARERSYSPYSGITVGAALLAKSGKVYVGTNIENASYTPTVCAERTAFFSAIVDGERDFVAIAISGGKHGEAGDDGFYPCGVCRQVMAEFCTPELEIITKSGVDYESHTLGEMLPAAFTPDKL